MGWLEDTLGGGDQVSTSEPWEPQQDYLLRGFDYAGGLMDQGPLQYYQGPQVAGNNYDIMQGMAGRSSMGLTGAQAGQDIMGAGASLMPSLNQAQQFYSDQSGGYVNPYASAKYQQTLADSVANNPVLNQQIQQGQQDINRNMQENILPSIASGAVGTGNTGSTRRGVAEGIAMRGAMEQGSDLATNLQSNAYNQGINQANQWAGGEQFGMNQQSNAANMLANLGQYGIGAQQAGYGMASGGYQDVMDTGAYSRGMEQELINADMQKWDFQQNAPWDMLQRYNQAVGGSYGGTTTQQGSGAGNQLMQMGAQLGSAALMGG